MRLCLVVAALLIASRVEAGPWCGGLEQWSLPAGTQLPTQPTVSFVSEDSTRLDTHAKRKQRIRRIVGTLDGKPVRLRTRDVRASHATVRYVEVLSGGTGALKLHVAGDDPSEDIEYAIVQEWKQPELVTTVSRYKLQRVQMASSVRQGLAVTVNTPALLFHIRWRRDPGDTWHELDVAATPAAQMGETDCWPDEIPVATLDAGIELTATAVLSNRKSVALDLDHVALPAK